MFESSQTFAVRLYVKLTGNPFLRTHLRGGAESALCVKGELLFDPFCGVRLPENGPIATGVLLLRLTALRELDGWEQKGMAYLFPKDGNLERRVCWLSAPVLPLRPETHTSHHELLNPVERCHFCYWVSQLGGLEILALYVVP